MQALEYDPVNFIKKNSRLVVPEQSRIKNISFSGFIRKAFHSDKRPKGVLTVTYEDRNGPNEIRIFVKQHAKAKQVHNHISQVYHHFKSIDSSPQIPKPLLCDEEHEVNYMEYVDGTPLTYFVLKELMIGDKNQLKNIFFKIGEWLKQYHNTFKLEKTFIINSLKGKVNEELEVTGFLKNDDKDRIKTHLNRLNLDDDFLVLVKTHNDFTLRNIIITKKNNFYVIDWDAINNEKYNSESPVWIDILSFLISINSYQRFSPIITASDLAHLNDSFLTGYFNESDIKTLMNGIKDHLYFFSLCYYLGVIGEKPLPVLYQEKLGYRYISKLQKNLINGYLL